MKKHRQTGPSPTRPNTNPTTLTDHHLHEWLDLLDQFREVHAPMAQIGYYHGQVTRLQSDLFRLRSIVD